MVCTTTGKKCGGSDFYSCHQVKAKAKAFYELRVRSERKIPINIGCGCAYPYAEQFFIHTLFPPGPQEKKLRNFPAKNVPEN